MKGKLTFFNYKKSSYYRIFTDFGYIYRCTWANGVNPGCMLFFTLGLLFDYFYPSITEGHGTHLSILTTLFWLRSNSGVSLLSSMWLSSAINSAYFFGDLFFRVIALRGKNILNNTIKKIWTLYFSGNIHIYLKFCR